ncbi:Ig domain-containing protein [Micromonospora sp. M12]
MDANGQTGTRLIVLVVNLAPTLTFPPPPLGEVDAPYAEQLNVVGGTAPFTWSLATGALPPGLTLDAASGLVSGRPTLVGAFPSTVRVTDANGQTATRAIRILVQAESVATLTASTNATTFGAAVQFQVLVGPGVAEGSVTLIDELPNGVETRSAPSRWPSMWPTSRSTYRRSGTTSSGRSTTGRARWARQCPTRW